MELQVGDKATRKLIRFPGCLILFMVALAFTSIHLYPLIQPTSLKQQLVIGLVVTSSGTDTTLQIRIEGRLCKNYLKHTKTCLRRPFVESTVQKFEDKA